MPMVGGSRVLVCGGNGNNLRWGKEQTQTIPQAEKV